MSPTDPQFLYMVLILPALFGLTLIGEGISKLIHEETGGWISLVFGFLFIVIVAFAFLFFKTLLSTA
ncbi:MAG: hypothetical protein HYU80_04165 [Candidatus Blackburnbacteria bacterium]|nr:hypothetical protein [Candidatus Blackburnbacteria bacterium]